jgi:hypothetical protein
MGEVRGYRCRHPGAGRWVYAWMRDVTDDVHWVFSQDLSWVCSWFDGRVTPGMMLEGCMDSSRKQRLPASKAPAAIHSTCECVL